MGLSQTLPVYHHSMFVSIWSTLQPRGDQLTALLLLSPECPRHATANMMAHWPLIFDLRCSSAKWITWDTLNLFQPIHDYHRSPITKQQNSPAIFSSSSSGIPECGLYLISWAHQEFLKVSLHGLTLSHVLLSDSLSVKPCFPSLIHQNLLEANPKSFSKGVCNAWPLVHPVIHSHAEKPLFVLLFSHVFHLRLLSAMKASSPDTEVTMIFPCHYLLARKPLWFSLAECDSCKQTNGSL